MSTHGEADDISFGPSPGTEGPTTADLSGMLRQTNELLQGLIQSQQFFVSNLMSSMPTTTAQPQSGRGSSTTAPQSLLPVVKAPDPNKPPLLKADISLEELDSWLEVWQDYARCVQLDRIPLQEQSSRFRSFLSLEMRSELKYGVGVQESDNLTPDEILAKIRSYVRGRRSIAIDRVTFEERKQKDGESFDAFYVGLKKVAANADLCKHCIDSRMTTRIMVGVADIESRKKLLAMDPFPTLDQVVAVCRSEESGKRNEEALSSNVSVNAVGQGRAPQHQSKKPARFGAKSQNKSADQDSCRRCGYSRHFDGQACPAMKQECAFCQKTGHFKTVCFKRLRNEQKTKDNADAKDVKETTIQSVQVNIPAAITDVSSHKAPRIWLGVYTSTKSGQYIGSIQATPDSAAEGAVAGRDVMQHLGIHPDSIDLEKSANIWAANKSPIKCLGSRRFTFKYRDRSVTDVVYFCEGVSGLLLPWYVCKSLGILHPRYPNPVVDEVRVEGSPCPPPLPTTNKHRLLSRAPVDLPSDDDKAFEENPNAVAVRGITVCAQTVQGGSVTDIFLDKIKQATAADAVYQSLSEIEACVKICEKCQELQPSLPKEPMLSEPPPQWVFQDTAMDLFSHAGQHFMVYTDRLSGWPVVADFGRNDPTSGRIIKDCRTIFSSLGVPCKLRTDNGPQFASLEFREFLKRWGIQHITSSPHYPQSNGLAESAVKGMKSLIKKVAHNGTLNTDEFHRGLLEYRNAPKANGLSPAEVVFGHPLRSHVPAHHSLFNAEWKEKMAKVDREFRKQQGNSRSYYDRGSHPLKALQVGQSVRVQDHITRRWTLLGEITDLGDNRDYWIRTKSGKVMRRNRRWIRPNAVAEETESSTDSEPQQLRRSTRITRTPERFIPGKGM